MILTLKGLHLKLRAYLWSENSRKVGPDRGLYAELGMKLSSLKSDRHGTICCEDYPLVHQGFVVWTKFLNLM